MTPEPNREPIKKTRTCLLVLGMHRSGTSAFSGTLAALGANLPTRLMPPHPMNPKGFFEPSEIVQIHERFLVSLDSCWQDWRPMPAGWKDRAEYRKTRSALVDAAQYDFQKSGPFVLKDPRVCRFAELWLDISKQIDARVVTFHVFRAPMEVASSLAARDGLDYETSLLLWLRHVLDAEFATREYPRAFISYAGLIANHADELSLVGQKVDVDIISNANENGTEIDTFLDIELNHSSSGSTRSLLPRSDWIDAVHLGLVALRQDPFDPLAIAELDCVREQMNVACQLFGPLALKSKHQDVRNHKLASELLSVREEKDILIKSLNVLTWVGDRISEIRENSAIAQQKIEELVEVADETKRIQTAFSATISELSSRADYESQIKQLEEDLGLARRNLDAAQNAADRLPELERELAGQKERCSVKDAEVIRLHSRVADLESAHIDLMRELVQIEIVAEEIPRLRGALAISQEEVIGLKKQLGSRRFIVKKLFSLKRPSDK